MNTIDIPLKRRPNVYYDDEIVEVGGYRFRVNFPYDHDHEAPWDDGDGQGIVSDWAIRDKRPGERVLSVDGRSRRFFDWKGTLAKAKLEGWGLGEEQIAELKAKMNAKQGRDPTPGDIIVESVERNFQWMRRWCNDQWHYVGIDITHLPDPDDDKTETDYGHAVWGFSDDDPLYLAEEVQGMLEAYVAELDEAKAKAEEEARAAAEERLRLYQEARGAVLDIGKVLYGSPSANDMQHARQGLKVLARRAGVPPYQLPGRDM